MSPNSSPYRGAAIAALNRLTSVAGSGAQTLAYGPGMQQPTNPAPLHGVISASGTSYGYDAAADRTNAGYASNLIAKHPARSHGPIGGHEQGFGSHMV